MYITLVLHACTCLEVLKCSPIISASWTWSRKMCIRQLKWWFRFGNHKWSMALEIYQTSCNHQPWFFSADVHRKSIWWAEGGQWSMIAQGIHNQCSISVTLRADMLKILEVVLLRVPLVCCLLKQPWSGHANIPQGQINTYVCFFTVWVDEEWVVRCNGGGRPTYNG